MFQMQSRLASMMTDSSRSLSEARSAREQLQKVSAQASGLVAEGLSTFEKKLVAVLGGAEAPQGAGATITGVSRAIGGLYAEAERADATPTTAQRNATSETERHFSEITTQWEVLKKGTCQN